MAMSESQPYHYTECGLDNVYLMNGFEYVETPRGTGVKIYDIEGLHVAIARVLVREKKTLEGKEFRFLRHELNLTQQDLAALLGVDVQRLARWEKDRNKQIDGPAQRVLRVLYEEHTNGNRNIIEPLRRLAALDEIIGDDEDEFVEYVPNEGWQPAQAA